ncbi:MAG TPA: AMP-binding protein [Terriglobia bacterium]
MDKNNHPMQTLVELLPSIERLGGREAVRWSNGYRTWTATYRDLYGRIGACVEYFDRQGLRKGDRVMIWAENRVEWMAAFWACVARGIEAVPVDYRFSKELAGRIRIGSRAKLVIDDTSLDAIAALPPVNRFTPSTVIADDVVEIVYTSGTTGEPKGVVHRHRNICSNLRPFQQEIAKYRRWAAPFQPVRILDLLPLSHMFGQSQGLYIPLFLEGSVAFTTEIHPSKVIRFIHDNRISVAVCVPKILENLKNEVQRRGITADRVSGLLRTMWRHRKTHRTFGWKFWAFVVGGARVDPELEEFWKALGYAVIQGYGLTEASPVVSVNHPFDTRTGSLGKVVPGQDVVIAPDGEILVRGESVTTDEEWLHTGDLGELDSEGRLYYRGRKKDLIVTPEGLNIYPEDVEKVLNSLPEIRESAVVGGDHVHAVLILNTPGTDVDALIRRANERLEAHQRIRSWSLWPGDDFPRTPSTLKIKRQEVARQMTAGAVDDRARTRQPGSPSPVTDLSAMSSLERVELLSELENKYQMEFDEDSFARLKSNQDLEAWLRVPERTAAPAEPETPLSEWARSFPVRSFRSVFQHLIALPLYRHYLPLTVSGLENLRDVHSPVIFAANHTSHLDVPTIYAALPHRWHPLLAPAMMKDHFRAYFEPAGHPLTETAAVAAAYFLACSIYNAYPLPQHMSGTRRALEYTADLLDRGHCPIVFPEGLRTTDGKMHPFRPGIGMMAVRLRVPVVPIRIRGLYEIYSVHDSWPRRGPVEVSIGTPLRFHPDTSYAEAADEIERVVRNL